MDLGLRHLEPARRMHTELLRFGPFVLDRRAMRLTRDGKVVELPPRAFALLDVLVGSPRTVLRRDDLMSALWPGSEDVTEGALSQVVLVLRRALGPEGTALIRTVARVGYAFEADVVAEPTSRVAEPADGTASPPAGPTAASSAPAAAPSPRPRRALQAGIVLAIAAVLLIVAMLAWRAPPTPQGVLLAIEAIRAAPASDASRPPPTWAAHALHDLLAASWRGQPGIALRLRDDIEPDPATGTVPVLRGTVAEDPDARTLRISWRLQGGGMDATWSDTVPSDRLFDALRALRDELPRRVPGLHAPGGPSGAAAESALLDYTAGIHALGDGRLVDARAHLARAVEAAPGFALARHALARALQRLGYRDLALSHARDALALLDDADPGHALIAQQALTLLNRHDEAIAQAQRLVDRQPDEPEWRLLLAASQSAAGALEAASSTLAGMDPARLTPRWRARWLAQRMRIATVAGRPDEATSTALELQSHAERHGFADLAAEARMARADGLSRQSRYAEAQAIRAEAIAWYDRAGAPHEALRARALQLGSAAWAGVDPPLAEFESVRDLARALGNPEVEAAVEFALANRAGTRYDYAAQRRHLLASRQLLQRLGDHPWLPTNTAALSDNDLRIGRLDETWQRLEQSAGAPDGRTSERWRLTRARALVRRALGDLPGAATLLRQAAAEAREDAVAGHAMLECEALSLQAQGLDGSAVVGPLRDCIAATDGATSDEDRAWRAAFMASLAVLQAREGDIAAARATHEEARALALTVDGIDRVDALMAIAPVAAALAPHEAVESLLTQVLDEPWARPDSRQRATLLLLRCLGGASAAARAGCAAARAVAPSDEGVVGVLLDLASAVDRGSPADARAVAAASGQAVLVQLADRLAAAPPAIAGNR